MPFSDERRKIEAVERLTAELCSPDLTLGRAKVVRARLFELIESGGSGEGESIGSHATREQDSDEPFHPEFPGMTSILQGPCVG